MRLLTAAATLFLTMSGFLIWIKAPISGGANPSLSFGWMAVLIGGIAGIGWFYRSNRVMAVCAVAGLGLCVFSAIYLALIDPAFWSLVDENAQYASMMSFSRRNLPVNYGIEPSFQINLAAETVQMNLSTETVMNRLATAVYFMSWGWWICLTGDLFLLIAYLKISGRRSRRWVALTTSAMLATQGIVLSTSCAAQYLQERGDRDMARGGYTEALQRYEAAQRLDRQLARSERSHLHLGDAYYQLGIFSHPNARFYLGDRYAQAMNFDAALAEYLLAAQEASTPLQEIIHKRITWTYISMGLMQYRKGQIGPASGWWEVALAFDPAQLQAAYFLVKAYFDQGRYEQSIATARFLLRRSRDPLLNANVQANLGDCYWRLNDFTKARAAYAASMLLDSFANLRIFKSLGGT
jgi:hypothetical protein